MRVVGLALFVLSIPLFYAFMNGPVANRRLGWMAVGAAPFLIGPLHLEVSIISWAFWPGYVKGMLVSLLDSLALAIVLTQREPIGGRPLLWAMILFLIGTGVATLFASPAMASFLFTWQVARTVLVFVAVSKFTSRPDGVRALVGGMAIGVSVHAIASLMQRAHGVGQASGLMGHQNLLGLCTHFVLLLSLASMLAGDRRWLPKIGIAGALIAVVLTGSRATTGLAGFGVVLLVVLSLVRQPTALKMRVAGTGLALLLAAAPVAYLTLHHRFEQNANLDGYDERAAFERAARAMWTDHPMGIGANQYVVKANTEGYSQRAGVVWTENSRSANVHNTYLLIGTETGYLGLGSFVLLLASGLLLAIRTAWARPRGTGGEMALGAAVTLAMVALHCFYEWVFVTWIIQYLFAITLGLIVGLDKQRRAQARQRPRRPLRLADHSSGSPGWAPPLPA